MALVEMETVSYQLRWWRSLSDYPTIRQNQVESSKSGADQILQSSVQTRNLKQIISSPGLPVQTLTVVDGNEVGVGAVVLFLVVLLVEALALVGW